MLSQTAWRTNPLLLCPQNDLKHKLQKAWSNHHSLGDVIAGLINLIQCLFKYVNVVRHIHGAIMYDYVLFVQWPFLMSFYAAFGIASLDNKESDSLTEWNKKFTKSAGRPGFPLWTCTAIRTILSWTALNSELTISQSCGSIFWGRIGFSRPPPFLQSFVCRLIHTCPYSV